MSRPVENRGPAALLQTVSPQNHLQVATDGSDLDLDTCNVVTTGTAETCGENSRDLGTRKLGPDPDGQQDDGGVGIIPRAALMQP